MQDALRTELYRQTREADNIADARALSLGSIQSSESVTLDRDDMMPLREVVAAMLGLKAACKYTYHGWASEYGRHVSDSDARSLLMRLVQYTKLLANELKIGSADLKPTDAVRVDKALDFAAARRWTLPKSFPRVESTQASPQPGVAKQVVKLMGKREHTMVPAIAHAQSSCGEDKLKTASVWAKLQVLAKSDNPPSPLVGSTGKGLKYLDNGVENNYTRKMLNDYLRRRREAR